MEEFLQDALYHSSGAFTLESPAQLESVRRLSNQSPWRWLEFALQGAVASRAQAAKIVVSPDSVEVLVLFESHQLSLQVGSQSGLPCVQDSTGVSSKFFHLAVLWGRCRHQNRVEESFQGKLSGFLRNFGKDGQLLDYSTLEESISPQWKLKLHLPDPCDRVQLEKLIKRSFRYAFLNISVNHVPIRRNLNLKDALLLHWDFSDEGPRSHQICAPAIDLAWPYFLINSCDVRTRLDIRSDQVVRISGKLSDRQDDGLEVQKETGRLRSKSREGDSMGEPCRFFMRRTQSGLGYLPIHFGRSLEPISDPSLESLGWTVVCATSHLRVDAEHARLVLDQDWITLKKRAQDLILSTYGLVRAPES